MKKAKLYIDDQEVYEIPVLEDNMKAYLSTSGTFAKIQV